MFRHGKNALKFVLATDLDGTLVGCKKSLTQLNRRIGDVRSEMLLIYTTGRTMISSLQLIQTENLLSPDILITDVGTQIHMGARFVRSAGWETKMSTYWDRSQIEGVFAAVDTLVPQPVVAPYRLAYTSQQKSFIDTLSRLNALKETFRLPIEIVPSLNHLIDIIPRGAGKGPALSYVQQRMGFRPAQVIVCGDSGNDYSMFTRGFRGIVVGNACPGFRSMLRRDKENIYMSPHPFAAGIMDGLNKYGILP